MRREWRLAGCPADGRLVVSVNELEDGMTDESPDPQKRTRLIRREYKPKRLSTWLGPLIIVVAIIIFLPKILALFE